MTPPRPLAFSVGRHFAAFRAFDRLGAELDIAYEECDRARNSLGSARRGPDRRPASLDALPPGR